METGVFLVYTFNGKSWERRRKHPKIGLRKKDRRKLFWNLKNNKKKKTIKKELIKKSKKSQKIEKKLKKSKTIDVVPS